MHERNPDWLPGLLPMQPCWPGISRTERVFVVDVVSFDWNCPQYITPRFTTPTEEVEVHVAAPLRARISALEGRLRNAG